MPTALSHFKGNPWLTLPPCWLQVQQEWLAQAVRPAFPDSDSDQDDSESDGQEEESEGDSGGSEEGGGRGGQRHSLDATPEGGPGTSHDGSDDDDEAGSSSAVQSGRPAHAKRKPKQQRVKRTNNSYLRDDLLPPSCSSSSETEDENYDDDDEASSESSSHLDQRQAADLHPELVDPSCLAGGPPQLERPAVELSSAQVATALTSQLHL